MWHGTLTEFQKKRANVQGLSQNQQRYLDSLEQARARSDLAEGSRALERLFDFLEVEGAALLDEASELDECFELVAQLAQRPDVERRELVSVYDDLVRRARAYRELAEQHRDRAAKFNEDMEDPAQFHELFTAKWAEKTGRPEQWLHSWPF